MDKKDKIKKHIYYHRDGTIYGQGFILNGKAHGYWEWFRKTGSKMRSGYFDKGKQTGKLTTYNNKGKVVKITSKGDKS